MDYKLILALSSFLFTFFVWWRSKENDKVIENRIFDFGVWADLRMDVKTRLNEFIDALSKFENLLSYDDDQLLKYDAIGGTFKEINISHTRLQKACRAVSQSGYILDRESWTDLAMKPYTDGETVLDTCGELINKITSAENSRINIQKTISLLNTTIFEINNAIEIQNNDFAPNKEKRWNG